jgi:hypothetical protein
VSWTAIWQQSGVRWAKLGAASLTTVVFLSMVPVWPWLPTCGGTPIIGDYRDIYVDRFAKWLADGDVYYWRIGDIILLRPFPWFDGTDQIPRRSILLNGERGFAEALSDDQTIDGVLYPAPEEVKRLKKELEPIIGPDPRRRPDGRWVHGSDTRVSRNCQLFRAAILEPES